MTIGSNNFQEILMEGANIHITEYIYISHNIYNVQKHDDIPNIF